jgi:predicted HicB family RNase H-like nuclease
MRQPVTAARVHEFMKALGSGVTSPARVFLVGGASAVLLGWRDSTVDIDLKAVPDRDDILRQLSALKERLEINIELASPDDFIPELPGWQDRSQFLRQEGKVTFLHYDFYAQALAKIERRHESDLRDVQEMMRSKLIEPAKLLDFFSRIEPDISKYPALDAASFRRAVEGFIRSADAGEADQS